MTDDSLAKQTTSSVMWMTAQKWIVRGGGFITIIVLTRLLAPEDFGVAAAASTLLPFVYVLADLGFSTYIVQSDEVDRPTLSTAFWFSLLTGGALAAAIYAIAPVIGMLLGVPEVVPLVQATTISVLIIAVSSVPLALLRRRMAFRILAIMEVTGSVLAQVVAITAAFLGAGAWALILQLIVAQVVTTAWVWVAARWHPVFEFSFKKFTMMAGFGIKVVGGGLTTVVRSLAETIIITAGVGVREMGYLNIAQRLVNTAQDLTASALLPVSTVAFSKVRDSPERLRSAYLRASAVTHAVVTPLMLAVAVTAPVLVPFLFGDDKAASARFLPALAVLAILNIGFSIDQGLHLGAGRPGRWLAFVAISYAVGVAASAYSIQYGLLVLAFTWIVTTSMELVGRWFLVGALVKTAWWKIAMPFLAIISPSVIAAGVGWTLMQVLAEMVPFATLAITATAVVVVYLAVGRLLLPRTFADIAGMLPARLAPFVRWMQPRRRDTNHQ